MARPRVFVSSTFYDLKHIRSSLEQFIEALGYEAVLSEKGSIAYDPDLPLDESCYREATHADIFVLIIGGRYGSIASAEGRDTPKDFYERYVSITKREYESAVQRDIPIYILVDRAVQTEYETFQKNRGRGDITYAHVDSVNVFLLIDAILNQSHNNPVHQFERHSEIATWLREQWGGLFKEMLARRAEQHQLASLADQVKGLQEINATLKTYLEEIVSRVSNREVAKKLIKQEDKRLSESQQMQAFAKHPWVKELVEIRGVATLEKAKQVFAEATSIEHFARLLQALDPKSYDAERLTVGWRSPDEFGRKRVNEARQILGLPAIDYVSPPVPTKPTQAKEGKAVGKSAPKKRSRAVQPASAGNVADRGAPEK